MSTTSQLIKVELINEKELLDLCEDVKNKISSLKHAGILIFIHSFNIQLVSSLDFHCTSNIT